MAMNDDDLDLIDDDYGLEEFSNTTTQDNSESISDDLISLNPSSEDYTLNSETEEDFIDSLLRSRGIEDRSKIKFENEEGEIEEVDWNSLNNVDRLNILESSTEDVDLDESEIQLINAIRSSLLSPLEYIQAIQRSSINDYLQLQQQSSGYKIDDLSDEDLFVMDLISRTNDITDDEAVEALEKAKQNETLFNKLVQAMRAEYRNLEDDKLRQQEYQLQQALQQQYYQFADKVEDSVRNFTELAGGKLDMDGEDMQELYDFITGFDSAGNSYLGKALSDTDTLVKMAWFALNGEETLSSILDYYSKEIARAREEGYQRGLLKASDRPQVIFKQDVPTSSESFDDLDDI